MSCPRARTVRALAALVLIASLPHCGSPQAPGPSSAFLTATNLGKAYLENRETAESIAAFEEAARLRPDSPAAWRNLARAYLQSRDAAKTAEALRRVRELDPDSAATHYLSGLAFARESNHEEAARHFEVAVRLDPHTAALRFQLARSYEQSGRQEVAVEQFLEAVRLDPLHTAAIYRLASHARQEGDEEELNRRLRELTRLRHLLGEEDPAPEALERCIYTEAEVPALPETAEEPGSIEVRFAPAGPNDPVEQALRDSIAAALLEMDAAGRYTLVAVGRDGRLGVLRPGDPGSVPGESVGIAVPDAILDAAPLVLSVGDFHDDVPPGEIYDPDRHARNDALVLSPGGALLAEQGRDGSFTDVTSRSGLSGVTGTAARWLDFDHDGDLDLAVAGLTGLALWQNGGDGRFEEVAEAVGIGLEGTVTDLAAVDLQADGAIDLVAARGEAQTLVFEGRRTGQFRRQPEPPGPWPAARRVLVENLDGDGRPDAVLVGASDLTVLSGAGGPPVRLAAAGFEPVAAALIDADNDGRPDIVAAGASPGGGGALRLWRNRGGGAWRDVTDRAGLGPSDAAAPTNVLAADLDDDGDTDLLLASADGLRLLTNEGGRAGGQLKVRLHGTKSNPSALGVQVEVRSAEFRVARSVQGVGLEIGLAGRDRIDSLQTVWTNGIVDNQIRVDVGEDPLTVVELNVAAGSCPFLYAWDGEGYRFVTDLLGNSPVGLSLRRGVPLPADPEEIVFVGPANEVPRRDGAWVLQVTDELREVLYLDHARLIVADHAAGVEVHPTDRLMPPPFPPSELWALGGLRVPVSARGDDGIDRTAVVAAIDGQYSAPGALLPPPLRGLTRELVLTFDFGPLSGLKRPVLVLTGWLQYGDASRNIAVSQNRSVKEIHPALEMETAAGAWVPLEVVVGMPAGKTKTIVVNLQGKLAPGARRLRLRTNLELRWDRIALGERLPEAAVEIHEVPASAAELRARGYSEIRARAPGHPTTPEFEALLNAPPWRTTPAGFVTRFGDVLKLLAARDGELVIMNGGDALELRFASDLPEPAPGLARTIFFYSVGWDKDEDHNVIDGTTVEPLPVVGKTGADLSARYNTRFVPRDAPVRAGAGS